MNKEFEKTLKDVKLTPKGVALIAWIECGLAPEVEGGYDNDSFEKFWAKYERLFYEYFGKGE